MLESLFEDVDAFCPDSELLEEGDMSESELRESARRALEKSASCKG